MSLYKTFYGTISFDEVKQRIDTLEETVDDLNIIVDDLEERVTYLEPLTLPDSFPVTLRKDESSYYIEEDGSDFLADYTGATIYLSPTGNDTTGNGTIGNPYLTINKGLLEVPTLGRLSLASGTYASPSPIDKNVAFVAPDGDVYIGSFYNLQGFTVTRNVGGFWNIAGTGNPLAGFIRVDGVVLQDTVASMRVLNSGEVVQSEARGLMAVQKGTNGSNLSIGTLEDLPTLIAQGAFLGWRNLDTAGITVLTTRRVYFGPGITIANNANAAVNCGGSSVVIMDGTHVFGGNDSTISHQGTGQLLTFNALITGSGGDNIDYRGTATGVEKNIVCVWPSTLDIANNASTSHNTAKVLRVGGLYRGGSRTIHDINLTKNYIFSCQIGDPITLAKTCLIIGSNSSPSSASYLGYGDITFLDTFAQGDLINLSIEGAGVVVNTELDDTWPY